MAQQPGIGFVMQPTANQVHYPQTNAAPHYPPQYPPQHQPFPQPIQQQPVYTVGTPGAGIPMASNWITSDFQQYLIGASSFRVKQKIDAIETLLNWEVSNKYVVKDQDGNRVFYAGEMSECMTRQCFDSARPFTMSIRDRTGREVLRFERPLRCGQVCCCICCPQTINVETANGQYLGRVVEEFSLFSQNWAIKDAAGNTVLKLVGPWMPCAFRCQQVTFKLKTVEGRTIGHITKEFGGIIREFFTDADVFCISFPPDLSADIKAVVLAGLFLIDFMYFEGKG